MVDGDRHHAWQCDSDLLEENLQIVGLISAAQFNDCDRLPGAVQRDAIEAGREVVARSELCGRNTVRSARSILHEVLDSRAPVFRPRVETKHSGDNFVEFLRNRDLSLSPAIGSRRVMVDLYVRGKRREQVAQLSPQHDGPLGSVSVNHEQVVLLSERLNLVQVVLRCTVLRRQFLRVKYVLLASGWLAWS